jgi:hypothetical protein
VCVGFGGSGLKGRVGVRGWEVCGCVRAQRRACAQGMCLLQTFDAWNGGLCALNGGCDVQGFGLCHLTSYPACPLACLSLAPPHPPPPPDLTKGQMAELSAGGASYASSPAPAAAAPAASSGGDRWASASRGSSSSGGGSAPAARGGSGTLSAGE